MLGSSQAQHTGKERSKAQDTKKLKEPLKSPSLPGPKRQRNVTQNSGLGDWYTTEDAVLGTGTFVSSLETLSASQVVRELRPVSNSWRWNHKNGRDYKTPALAERPLTNTPLYDALYIDPRGLDDYSRIGMLDFRDIAYKSQRTQPADYDLEENQPWGMLSPEDEFEYERIWRLVLPASFCPQIAKDWEERNRPLEMIVYEAQLKQLEDYKMKV